MEYKKTLNMTKSGFPMRAGLPKREPEMLKHWEELDLYHELLKKNEGKPRFALHRCGEERLKVIITRFCIAEFAPLDKPVEIGAKSQYDGSICYARLVEMCRGQLFFIFVISGNDDTVNLHVAGVGYPERCFQKFV